MLLPRLTFNNAWNVHEVSLESIVITPWSAHSIVQNENVSNISNCNCGSMRSWVYMRARELKLLLEKTRHHLLLRLRATSFCSARD